MAITADAQGFATHDHYGHLVVVVHVTVAHAAAKEHRGAIEQRRITVVNRFELLEEVIQHLDVVRVDLRVRRELVRMVVVVRDGMMRIGDADLRIGTAGVLARHHEGADARDVGLERQRLKVEQQLDILLERRGHANRLIRHG